MFVFSSPNAKRLVQPLAERFPELTVLPLAQEPREPTLDMHPVLGVVVATSDDGALRERADEIVVRRLPPPLQAGAVLELETNDSSRFAAWLVARQTALIAAILPEHSHSQTALAAARIDLQQTQSAFAKLEDFLRSLALPNSWVTYSRDCDGEYHPLVSGGDETALLEDAIPHLIQYPAAIALALRPPLMPRDDHMTLELYEFESGRVLGEWVMPLSDIVQQWTVFEVDPEVGECNYLAYRLQVPNRPHDPLRIGLSQLPQHKLAATSKPGVVPPRAPAIRIYRGVPSRRRTSIAGAHLTIAAEEKAQPSSRSISFDQLREAELVRTHRMPDNWKPITWLHRESGLMVHPTGVSPTIARIRGVELNGQRTIMATCMLAHDEAPDVECAVALEPLEMAKAYEKLPASRGGSHLSEEMLSGLTWTRLKSRDYAEIRESIGAHYGLANLLLLSRMAAEGDSNNCRVTFKGVLLY